MEFKITKKSKKSRARRGIIKTPHGDIHTPAFIPVATKATVKGMTIDQLKALGIESILSNTYHLYLKPGDEIVKKMGGLHKFMNWDRPMWTDSGGFQAFSLGYGLQHKTGKLISTFADDNEKRTDELNYHQEKLAKVTEEGVEFRSHIDGSKHFFTPEKSMKIQENLGADIIFAFDECTSPLHDYKYTKKSMERTHRWAKRCLKSHKKKNQALFGIVQGGAFEDLRKESAEFIGAMDFPGFGIGGSLGKSRKEMYDVIGWTTALLPESKPRHLLGVGSEVDIREAVRLGADTFDCVLPTRLGRNGSALIKDGKLVMRSPKNLTNKNPIDKKCGCYACQNHSRSYISHLFRAKEMQGPILVTVHNLHYMEQLMKDIRAGIDEGKI